MILAAITTHKRRPEMVERAIKSVIAQTYRDWNLVVVDDSPADWELRDDVRRMVEDYLARDGRVRYVAHDRNYGAQRARNTALEIACGEGFEYIAYLDDDDEWLPEKLEKQLAVFNGRDANTALVYCWSYIQYQDGSIKNVEFDGTIKPSYEGKVYDKLITASFIGTCSNPLIRVEYLKAVNGFDEEVPARQDWETWLRLAKLYEVGCVKERLLVYHMHMEEHIAGNPLTQVRGIEIIIDRNIDYLKENLYAYWKLYTFIILQLAESGEYRKFFKTLSKAISLQPLRVLGNMWVILLSLKSQLRFLLRKRNENLYLQLRPYYRMVRRKILFWRDDLP